MHRSAFRIALAAAALTSAAALTGCTFHLTTPTIAPTSVTTSQSDDGTASNGDQPPAGYIEQKSDGGNLVVWVPDTWTDTDTQTTTDADGASWVRFDVAPSVDAYNNDITQPGMTFEATTDHPGVEAATLLSDALEAVDQSCTQTSKQDYDDKYFTGQFYWYKDCTDTPNSQVALFVGNSEDLGTAVLIDAQFEPGVDHTADMQQIMTSFNTAF